MQNIGLNSKNDTIALSESDINNLRAFFKDLRLKALQYNKNKVYNLNFLIDHLKLNENEGNSFRDLFKLMNEKEQELFINRLIIISAKKLRNKLETNSNVKIPESIDKYVSDEDSNIKLS